MVSVPSKVDGLQDLFQPARVDIEAAPDDHVLLAVHHVQVAAGYFGVEFRNITFTGERAAAEKTLAAYQVYERDDRHIRALNRSGDLRAAIAFDTSYAQGNSNYAFTQYDNALAGLIAINQRAFDGAISAGQQDMNDWTSYIPAAAAALIIVLVLADVRPRLAEYR